MNLKELAPYASIAVLAILVWFLFIKKENPTTGTTTA